MKSNSSSVKARRRCQYANPVESTGLSLLTNIINEYSKTHPELSGVEIKIAKGNDTFIGYCHSEPYGEYVRVGKMRYKRVITSRITLTENDPNMLFTFFHEMTHAITPQYERKVKNNWIRMDHSDKFYKNFYEVMQTAYQKKIICKEYTLSELKRRDGCQENIRSDRARFSQC